jgi:hypothetical protein
MISKKERVMYMYGAYGYPQLSYYDYIRQSMGQTPQPAQQQANVLPAQQVIQVAGRQSIDTLQMSPNSSVLIMDTSAPIVWLCVSDGLGKVTATAYDITVHQDTPPFDVAGFAGDVEKRLQALEKRFVEVDINAGKPDATDARSGKANDWKARRD